MNNTKTPTAEKKVFPLRLPPDLYKEVRKEVQKEKDKSKTPTRKYDLNCRIKSLQGEIRRLQDEKA